MSELSRITQITGATGTETPNFTNGFNINGSDSGITGFTHTEGETEPTSPSNGDTWWDSANSVYKVYANGAWQTLIGSGGSLGDVWGGTRGFTFAGTTNGNSSTRNNSIHYFDTTSAGNAVDFGDLTQQVRDSSCAGNGTRLLRMGGYISGNPFRSDTIDYITCATTGNATDFGDLLSGVGLGGAVSDGTYAIQVGGNRTSTSGISDQLEYVTIATLGNGTDFGDLVGNRQFHTCTNDKTRGVSMGGTGLLNNIDYFTMATPGNALDFGDLVAGTNHAHNGTVSNDTRGLIMGGTDASNYRLNKIEYITIQTTGNAADFGNLTIVKAYLSGCSNESGDKGFSIGGDSASTQSNVIDVVTISTTGNATDFGDGLNNYMQNAGASGNAS